MYKKNHQLILKYRKSNYYKSKKKNEKIQILKKDNKKITDKLNNFKI